MSNSLKKLFWDLARPIHRPVTTALRRRLGGGYFEHPEMELPPPYESAQLDVERHLHRYLHRSAQSIGQIVIVGAHEGDEVPRLQLAYPAARLHCFDPNPESCRRLHKRFAASPAVTISQLALGEAKGRMRFYELPMSGNGSLLPPDPDRWALANQQSAREVSSYEVEVSTMDDELRDVLVIDLLWMDVQGAEGLVLKGATKTLARTQAIFAEVALVESAYTGAALFPEISATLQPHGFTCVGLGTDAWNFTGNALFVRGIGDLSCKENAT